MAADKLLFIKSMRKCTLTTLIVLPFFSTTIAIAQGKSNILSQSRKDVVITDLVVCSDLDFVSKKNIQDYYLRLRSSALDFLAEPESGFDSGLGLTLLVASDGSPSETLLSCLRANISENEDILQTILMDISRLGQPPIIQNIPGGNFLGATDRILSFRKRDSMRIVIYGTLVNQPSDVDDFYKDFFGLPD